MFDDANTIAVTPAMCEFARMVADHQSKMWMAYPLADPDNADRNRFYGRLAELIFSKYSHQMMDWTVNPKITVQRPDFRIIGETIDVKSTWRINGPYGSVNSIAKHYDWYVPVWFPETVGPPPNGIVIGRAAGAKIINAGHIVSGKIRSDKTKAPDYYTIFRHEIEPCDCWRGDGVWSITVDELIKYAITQSSTFPDSDRMRLPWLFARAVGLTVIE